MPFSSRHRRSSSYQQYEHYPTGTEQWILEILERDGPHSIEQLSRESLNYPEVRTNIRGIKEALRLLESKGQVFEVDDLYYSRDRG